MTVGMAGSSASGAEARGIGPCTCGWRGVGTWRELTLARNPHFLHMVKADVYGCDPVVCCVLCIVDDVWALPGDRQESRKAVG